MLLTSWDHTEAASGATCKKGRSRCLPASEPQAQRYCKRAGFRACNGAKPKPNEEVWQHDQAVAHRIASYYMLYTMRNATLQPSHRMMNPKAWLANLKLNLQQAASRAT